MGKFIPQVGKLYKFAPYKGMIVKYLADENFPAVQPIPSLVKRHAKGARLEWMPATKFTDSGKGYFEAEIDMVVE